MIKSIKIKNQTLVYLCILSLLGSRILVSMGFPSILNFVHFGFAILVVLFDFIKGRVKAERFTIFIIVTIAITVISAIMNIIAPLNTILTILVILEPFIVINTYERWDDNFFVQIENLLIAFSILNMIISYYQYFIQGLVDDDVRGIFVNMSSGAHLNGAFAIVMALYIAYNGFKYKRKANRIISIIISVMMLFVVLMCDNKQSIIGYGIGLLVFLLFNIKNFKRFIKIFFIAVVGALILYVLLNTVLYKATGWLDKKDYVYEGIKLKFSFFGILRDERTSVFQLFFGFGPGMTLSRVARILPEYDYLSFLGVSYSEITEQFQDIVRNSWLIRSSSLWMFFFSFASFFGDLGIFGFISIMSLYIDGIKRFAKGQFSKYIFLVVLSHGILFDWLEEPSFVLVYFLVVVLLDHDWKTKRKRLLFLF